METLAEQPKSTQVQINPVRVLVLANHDFYVEGILGILSRSSEIGLARCERPNGDCKKILAQFRPDVLLVDRRVVPDEPGSLIKQFREGAPDGGAIVFGQGMQDFLLIKLVRAGFDGYLRDSMTAEDVVNSILAVSRGEIWVERHIAARLVRNSRQIEDIIQESIDAIKKILTSREAEVFRYVLDGLSTKEIANEMHLSEQSVKLYLSNLFKKFDVNNRAQLILLAFQRVCPVNNVLKLFRMSMDKHRIDRGETAIIPDPLDVLFDAAKEES
ncbi:helix-turn-helix transcriptional regulator [Sulfuriferula nivalis]|uniref:HTH luxR-type domain-containing protein n=1 Tax=Sulfuriferula nivalis TaxID=2675298 RepID=A0A809RCJ7_9PROT|nr:response regulator transcription factor [Sulfuriferula nivalis]BBO99375.1 hypothetical protein SFSGTM_00840 [Sulfuriferula nivalis]